MNRRTFLSAVGAGASLGIAGSVGGALPSAAQPAPLSPIRGVEPTLRIAQLTDTHVFQDRDCPARMRAFLARFRSVVGAPDVVLHTGDVIYDALEADRDAVATQWALWAELAAELPAQPVYAIGNHDVWGQAPRSDPLYAKQWAVEALELSHRYYSFNRGGWHFIVLDSTHPTPPGWYTAKLDAEQLAWLEHELATTDASIPIAIVSHIPLLSAALLQWAKSEGEAWTVSNALMHGDSHTVQALLRHHPNVKLCLSGHLHLLDEVVYDGISYLGCGAVSGDWWRQNSFHQTRCGFATLNLYVDGSFDRTYHPYDWPPGP